MSEQTAQEHAESIGVVRRLLGQLVRRMVVSLSDGGTWQLLGHTLFGGKRETRSAEAWQGIGFASRPPAGSTSAEAIALQVGGENQRAIVATRDEAVRSASAQLDPDESAIFNTLARVRVRADGLIELVSIVGVGQATIRGATYRAAEDTMLTAIQALLTALATSAPALGTAPQQAATATAATAAATAITAFKAAAASYLTTVVRVE